MLRPFAGATTAEIKSQPKVYAFDTGFVCYFREWNTLRSEDRGHLLEHLVLNELLAIEAKCRSTSFDASGLRAFRGRHPVGRNIVVCLDLPEPLSRRVGDLEVRFVPFERFDAALRASNGPR